MIDIDIILLDLDGVIRDWVGGIWKLFDMTPKETFEYQDVCNYVCKEYGISKSYFWERQDKDFWINLKMYSWANDLRSLLPYSITYILTSPTKNNAGWSQKWISENFPTHFVNKKYLIGPAKHLCANPRSLLIDDYDVNIDAFKKYGGNAILFPQSWNANHHFRSDRIRYMKEQLIDYKF